MIRKEIRLPKHIRYLSDIFKENGIELFLVGGYVRNSLLSLEVTDLDIASKARPEKVREILKGKKDIITIPKALDFGTVQVDIIFKEKKYSFEHTTFRKDFYHDDGTHRPSRVEFTESLEQDASRRDFTVNSIYYKISSEEIVDPLGGIQDLERMVIRAAKRYAEETLADDGLRIMRMARFAAELNFSVSPDLFRAAKRFSYYLMDITAERKQQEFKKIVLSDIKYSGFEGAFKTNRAKRGIIILKEANALKYILPSLIEGTGISQDRKYHAHDVLMHNINTMAKSEPDYALRLAGLLHDIGKPTQLITTGKMHDHDMVGSEIAKKELNSLRTPKATTSKVCMLIENHMFDLEGNAKDSTIRKKAAQLGFDNMLLLASLRRADFLGSGKDCSLETASRWEKIVSDMRKLKTPESVSELKITGKEIIEELNIDQGEKVGRILERLFQIALQKPKQNEREKLLAHARNIIKEREFIDD